MREGPTRPPGTVLCCGSVLRWNRGIQKPGGVSLVREYARGACTSNQRTRALWLVRLVARGRFGRTACPSAFEESASPIFLALCHLLVTVRLLREVTCPSARTTHLTNLSRYCEDPLLRHHLQQRPFSPMLYQHLCLRPIRAGSVCLLPSARLPLLRVVQRRRLLPSLLRVHYLPQQRLTCSSCKMPARRSA